MSLGCVPCSVCKIRKRIRKEEPEDEVNESNNKEEEGLNEAEEL